MYKTPWDIVNEVYREPSFDENSDKTSEELLMHRFNASENELRQRIPLSNDFYLYCRIGSGEQLLDNGRAQNTRFFIMHKTEPVGLIAIRHLKRNIGSIVMSYIKPNYRNSGVGYDAYCAILNKGIILMSDAFMTPAAIKIWQKLRNNSAYTVGIRLDSDPDKILPYDDETIDMAGARFIAMKKENLTEDFYRDLNPHRSEKFGQPEFKPEIPHWPLSPMEMKQVERQVFQSPEWLQYWAYFGWRSYTQPAEWHYSKHQNLFVFYNVPEISYFHDTPSPNRGMLQMTPSGEIVKRNSEYAHLSEYLPTCVEICREKVRQAQPKLKFLKGTYYIRFGMWPKNELSRNWLHRDEKVYEKGVSAYHADYDLDEDRWAIDPTVDESAINGTMQTLIYGNRPVFIVQGDELSEEGADGEPLLKNVKLIMQIDKDAVYVPGIFDPKDD